MAPPGGSMPVLLLRQVALDVVDERLALLVSFSAVPLSISVVDCGSPDWSSLPLASKP